MSSQQHPRYSEWLGLISERLDERETPESGDRLDAYLLESDEACSLYLDLVDIHLTLGWEAVDQRLRLDTSKSINAKEPVPQPPKVTVLKFLERTTAVLIRPAVWSTLSAGILFLGYMTLISWNLWGTKLPSGTDGDDLAVAAISYTRDAKWADEKSEISNLKSENQKSEIGLGEPLHLNSGFVELQLEQGATLLVEGPAQWSIDGANSGTLIRGKLLAKVPTRAAGFTLQIPSGKIVDLGTEFGVDVAPNGKAALQIFQGKVELHTGTAERINLTGGQAGTVDRAGFQAKQPEARAFESLRQGTHVKLATDIDLLKKTNEAKWWTDPSIWSDGKAPHAGAHYHAGRDNGGYVRTLAQANPPAFAGDSLTIHSSAALTVHSWGALQIADLRLDGGQIAFGRHLEQMTDAKFSGRMRVLNDSSIELWKADYLLACKLEGTGGLRVTGPGRLRLATVSWKFSGDWRITDAVVVAQTDGSLGSGNIMVGAAGKLEPEYDVHNPQATLTLEKGASLETRRRLTFGRVVIRGQPLASRTYTSADLRGYPELAMESSGSLTVLGDPNAPRSDQSISPSSK